MTQFECQDVECGATFGYLRVSCGRAQEPRFCPTCGGDTVVPAEAPASRGAIEKFASHADVRGLNDRGVVEAARAGKAAL